MQDGCLKQGIHCGLRPVQHPGYFGGNVRDPLSMVDMCHTHQVKRIRKGVNRLVKINSKQGHGAAINCVIATLLNGAAPTGFNQHGLQQKNVPMQRDLNET
jgi:hypothetical protein